MKTACEQEKKGGWADVTSFGGRLRIPHRHSVLILCKLLHIWLPEMLGLFPPSVHIKRLHTAEQRAGSLFKRCCSRSAPSPVDGSFPEKDIRRSECLVKQCERLSI